jgi:hypothetical protein
MMMNITYKIHIYISYMNLSRTKFDSIKDQNTEIDFYDETLLDPNDPNPECSRMIANYRNKKTRINRKTDYVFDSNANIPNDILYDILEQVAIKYYDYYYFNYTSYRKLFFLNLFEPFIESIIDMYKPEYHFYLTKRPVTYNMVVTILRQICKKNNIPFKIMYSLFKSMKNHDYCIYYNPTVSTV